MPTNEQVVRCNEALPLLDEERLPWETSMAVSEFQRSIRAKVTDIEAVRMKIATEYAELDEKGKLKQKATEQGMTIIIDQSRMAEFVDEMTDVMGGECPNAPCIESSWFEGLELPHKVSSALHPFLKKESGNDNV